jgi:hypothetical protein
MNEILLGSLVDKVDAQDRKIEDLNRKIDQTPNYEELLSQFKTGFEGLRIDVQKISFPEKEMFELSERLATSIDLFKRPVEQKIIQCVEITKVIWITAALFLIVCLVSTAWFTTYNKVELYKANDTKYRYLKLNASSALSKWLSFIDSVNNTDPKMREFVIAKEAQNQKDFEMMQKALQMEYDAKELKKKVHSRGR